MRFTLLCAVACVLFSLCPSAEDSCLEDTCPQQEPVAFIQSRVQRVEKVPHHADTAPALLHSAPKCADFTNWPDLDLKCGADSCMALVKTKKHGGRCDKYCESFGHKCVAAAEERRDTCKIKRDYKCDEAIRRTRDMLCTCHAENTKPAPPPPPPSALTCADFTNWPDWDGVSCGAGSCKALVETKNNGGRCDTYCESFGHKCVAAAEERGDTCKIKRDYECNEAILDTSDMLCTCQTSSKTPSPTPTPPPAPKPMPKPTPMPTPPAPSDTTLVDTPCVNMLNIGDFGSGGRTQRDVAAGMARVAQQTSPVFCGGNGDNIYGRGAEGLMENMVKRWQNIYLKHESLKMPWHIVTGNHDWYTDARIERDFTKHHLNTGGYWQMPGFWYKKAFKSTVSGLVVDTFWIDTELWKGSSKPQEYLGSEALTEQKAWLESSLRESTADWKIVVGHHPVYSRGSHGLTRELFEDLDPMMRRYGVQAYICGHDHSKHLIQYEGLSYIVNGAGGKGPRSPSNQYPVGSLVEDHQNTGFATIKLCKDTPGELVFFSASGTTQSTSKLPAEAPKSGLSGSVKLANKRSLKFPGPNGADFDSMDNLAERQCGKHLMKEVDKFCPSADGSGCRVIADQSPDLTCNHYCSTVNGLACKTGWEEDDEDCHGTNEVGCFSGSDSIDNLICECEPTSIH